MARPAARMWEGLVISPSRQFVHHLMGHLDYPRSSSWNRWKSHPRLMRGGSKVVGQVVEVVLAREN